MQSNDGPAAKLASLRGLAVGRSRKLGLLEGDSRSLTLGGGCNPALTRWTGARLQAEINGARAARSGMCLRRDREGVLHGIQATDAAAGAHCRGAIAHHEAKQAGQQQPTYDDQAAADDQQDLAAADEQDQAQYAPPPADPADEIEHLAQLHGSGVLTDDEFTAAKAKILGT
jgi:hypothetical protein